MHIRTTMARRMANTRVARNSTSKVATGNGTGAVAAGAAAVGTGAGSAKALVVSAMLEANPRANTAG